MEEVMDRVVETLQHNLLQSLEAFVCLVTGNLVYKCQFVCRDGSRVPVQI